MDKTFTRPIADGVGYISNTFGQHVARKSVNPGVDFAVPKGTPVRSPKGGTIAYAKNNTSGAGGRMLVIYHDGGGSSDLLHNSKLLKTSGRVETGEVVALSGGSAYGSETGVGNHLHWTLRTSQSTCLCNSGNVDGLAWLGSEALLPNQRRATNVVKRRIGAPSVTAPAGGEETWLQPGAVANFDGWIYGDSVDGNNIWYRGLSGDFFWSTPFEGGPNTIGLTDLNPISPTQRKATVELKGRAAPSTNAAEVTHLKQGAVGEFTGWMHAELVDGDDRWVQGAISGAWFALRYLTPQDVTALADLNPPPISKVERTVAVNPANVRKGPYISFDAVRSIDGGSVHEVLAWAHGENVRNEGNDVWFRLGAGEWAWSGGFTSQSIEGINEDIDPPRPTNPYVFEPFDRDVVTRTIPAARGNFEDGQNGLRFPKNQTEVVLHDFGTFKENTFDATLSWFQNPASFTSSHLVISGAEIVQMVSLADRAFHAGPDGNWHIGIEIDPVVGQPEGTPGRAETIASVRKAIAALEKKYGVTLRFRLHSEFMATQCGDDIHFSDFRPVDPPVPPDPTPGQTLVDDADLDKWADALAGVGLSISRYLGEK